MGSTLQPGLKAFWAAVYLLLGTTMQRRGRGTCRPVGTVQLLDCSPVCLGCSPTAAALSACSCIRRQGELKLKWADLGAVVVGKRQSWKNAYTGAYAACPRSDRACEHFLCLGV